MGRIKNAMLAEEQAVTPRTFETVALHGFPELRDKAGLSLAALASLPIGHGLTVEIAVDEQGRWQSRAEAIALEDAGLPPGDLIQLLMPKVAPGVGYAPVAERLEPIRTVRILPGILNLPGAGLGQLRDSADPPGAPEISVPAAMWPWNLEEALTSLAICKPARLRLGLRHLGRSARIERLLAAKCEEITAATYSRQIEGRAWITAATEARLMRDGEPLLLLEVSLAGAKVNDTICNFVAQALFGTLATIAAGDDEDDGLAGVMPLVSAPARLLPLAREVERIDIVGPSQERASSEQLEIGVTTANVPITLNLSDRARHAYLIGATGTGKSTLIKHMVRQDIAAREGVIVIDPHGDLVEDLCESLPADRQDDLVLADAASEEGGLALRVLPDTRDSVQLEIASDLLIDVFKHALYEGSPEAFGPIFEQYFRNALALLMWGPAGERGLADLPRVFEEGRFRRSLLERCEDSAVKSFWRNTATQARGEAELSNLTPYITGKLTRFIASSTARRLFPEKGPFIDFAQLMDQGKITLVRCPQGALGPGLAQLVMSVIMMQVRIAAMARHAYRARRPVRIYVDEFQVLRGSALKSLLAEGRKFGISLVVANQSLGQIGNGSADSVGSSILANVGNIIAFRVGAHDALRLSPWLADHEDWRSLCRLPDFTMHARILENGRPRNLHHLSVPKATTDASRAGDFCQASTT